MVSKQSLLRVNKAIEKLQYRPNLSAQKFRLQRTNTIVVLVPDIANLFFATLISGVEDTAAKHGYNVLLGDTRDNMNREEEFIRLVETRQADGLIQLTPHSKNALLPMKDVKAINAAGCEGTPYLSVRIDNIDAAQKMVQYLINLGHKRIGVISGLRDNAHSKERLQGYRQALEKAGLSYEENLVVEGDFKYWSGLNAVRHILKMEDRPTAIFCANDQMAIGAMKGIKEQGLRIPEDISITGFDDLDVSSYCDPSLTTIRQPAVEMGEKAAELLFRIIDGRQPSFSEYILPYEIIIRDSTSTLK